MRLVAVEPHPDDLVLSCIHLLTDPRWTEVFIFSANSWDLQIKEGYESVELLNQKFGRRFQFIPGEYGRDSDFIDRGENGWNSRDKSAWGYSEWHPYYTKYIERYGETELARLRSEIQEVKPDLVVGPLGLLHPFHYVTRRAVEPICDVLYAEWPYWTKKKCFKRMNEAVPAEFSQLQTIHDPKMEAVRKELLKPYLRGTQSWMWRSDLDFSEYKWGTARAIKLLT